MLTSGFKKRYVAPRAVLVNIAVKQLLCTSPGEEDEEPVSPGYPETPGEEDM